MSHEQLRLDGMEAFQIPDDWLPSITVEVTNQPIFKTYRVSKAGQLTLPASARRRWGIMDEGSVNVFDVDGAVFIFPEEIHPDTAQELIRQSLSPIHEELPTSEVRTIPLQGILHNMIGRYE